MKKIAKALILVLLLATVGVGGFVLGSNTAMQGAVSWGASDEGVNWNRILSNLKNYEAVIDQDFLFEYTPEDLEVGVYKGLFEGLQDPYSEYFSPEEYQRLMEDTTGQFAGVGLVVTAGEDNAITVVAPIANTPAARAGIKAGDIILEVDGQSYAGTDLDLATQMMRGEPNTQVDLTVRRTTNGKAETLNIPITREIITVDTVVGKKLDNNVGYIQITSFEELTADEFKQEWDALVAQGATRFVLDLRNNPGGLLVTAEDIADALLGEATIVTTVDSMGQEEVSTSDAAQYSQPIVVLANEGSASASEILLGALRDNHRAKSVGTKTFGKGIVQRIYPLGPNGEEGGFKLTMAEYLTPSGEQIHGVGITPDIVVEDNWDAKGYGPDFLSEDPQLQRALQVIQEP